jgi:hypothetical protein
VADVHVPDLEEEPDEPVPAENTGPASPRRRTFVRIAVEVALISAGVFLGLLGEQWREHAAHRELARASLQHFRVELNANRDAVAAVAGKHETKLGALREYFAAHRSDLSAALGDPAHPLPAPPDTDTDPAFFEYAAWDVALSSGAMAYVDPDLAVALAHVYRAQQQYDESTRAITSAMYSFHNEAAWLQDVATYFGDCTLFEPRLLKLYDEILPRLDRAIAE